VRGRGTGCEGRERGVNEIEKGRDGQKKVEGGMKGEM
jgi:hypothetical protein